MSQDSETGTEDVSTQSAAEVLDALAAEFQEFCQLRHNDGAVEYGPIAFLKNSMFKMIAEEMADIANYCMYEYIKLRLMEGSFNNESGVDFTPAGDAVPQHDVPSASSAFVGAGELQELLDAAGRLPHPRQRSS